ncbi:MAG: ATP-binding protein [Dehalococcoidia bacterium]
MVINARRIDELQLILMAIEDVTEQKRNVEDLRSLNETLERRVHERTAEAHTRADQLRELASELGLAERRERRRLSRILHDNLQQLLIAANLRLSRLESDLAEPNNEDLLGAIREVRDLVSQSMDVGRNLSADLSPQVLYEQGLAEALKWLAHWDEVQFGLKVDVNICTEASPESMDIRDLLYQAVREALLNVVKHADVDEASVNLDAGDADLVRITVSDAGRGFDPHDLSNEAEASTGLGLVSLGRRLRFHGGCMDVDSAPGRGARITFTAPVPDPKKSQ